jgi:hypothetical protein
MTRVSNRYHSPRAAGKKSCRRPVTCGAITKIRCPRGDLNPHALNGH